MSAEHGTSVAFRNAPLEIGVLETSESGTEFKSFCQVAVHGQRSTDRADPARKCLSTSPGSISVRLTGGRCAVEILLNSKISLSFDVDDQLSVIFLPRSILFALPVVPRITQHFRNSKRSWTGRCVDETLGGEIHQGVLSTCRQYVLDCSTSADHASSRQYLLESWRKQSGGPKPFISVVDHDIAITRRSADEFSRSLTICAQRKRLLGQFDVAFEVENALSLGVVHVFQLPGIVDVLRSLPGSVACGALRELAEQRFDRSRACGREIPELYASVALLQRCVQQVTRGAPRHGACRAATHHNDDDDDADAGTCVGESAGGKQNGGVTCGVRPRRRDISCTPAADALLPESTARGAEGTDEADKTYMRCHRVYVTPLTIQCGAVQREITNRVVRNFWSHRDRFVRVHFCDESLGHLSRSPPVVKRVRKVMAEGFDLCGRHYELLAFSASQLRDHSAWFFARDAHLCAADIRTWLGDFRSITNPAKYFARLGQSFSATHTTSKLARLINRFERIPDVRSADGKYVFSDGVGRISLEFARKAASAVGIDTQQPLPSAFQIRFGGHKGVVSIFPRMPAGVCLQLRGSMDKFDCKHDQLEVIRTAQCMPGFLNRQLIVLLSTLGVPDSVFVRLQEKMTATLSDVLLSKESALSTLRMHGCYLASSPLHCLVDMLESGLSLVAEPFIQQCLLSLARRTLRSLRDRSRIAVEKSGCFMGIMDEESVLEYGQVFLAVRNSADKAEVRVLTGNVVVGKNPCYHPGDLRVLQCVDHPSLRHLVDCIVFPQRGPRPHPDECSGSDLDGDLYFVTWEKHLIPPRTYEAMDYTAPPPISCSTGNVVENMADNFVQFLTGDMLGVISNAHLALSDRLESGALSPQCLELAHLSSQAVDYPKTGVPAVMGPHLKVRQFPDFMQKPGGWNHSYASSKILGHLYRAASCSRTMAEAVADDRAVARSAACASSSASDYCTGLVASLSYHCDDDLLAEGYEKHLEDARSVFRNYRRRMQLLMEQHHARCEADLFAGVFATGVAKSNGRASFRFSSSKPFDALRREQDELSSFLKRFYEIEFLVPDPAPVPSSHGDGDAQQAARDDSAWLQRSQFYLAKASAWYKVCMEYNLCRSAASTRCDSFPWLAYRQICALKRRKSKQSKLFPAMARW